MKSHTKKTVGAVSMLILLAALLIAASPNFAQKAKVEYLERFRMRAYSMDTGPTATENCEVSITRWTTAEERQGLLKILAEQGNLALANAMKQQPDHGFISCQAGRQTLRYARSSEEDGKRVIVTATDRPLDVVEVFRPTRSGKFQISLVELRVNDKNKGDGSASIGVEFSYDGETLTAGTWESHPIRLVSVRPR